MAISGVMGLHTNGRLILDRAFAKPFPPVFGEVEEVVRIPQQLPARASCSKLPDGKFGKVERRCLIVRRKFDRKSVKA